jgi:DNA-binding beta-propeller fold protein YncE
LLAAGLAVAACGRKKGTGFGGYAFVANEDGQAIAAVDLTAFAVIRHIHVSGNPTDVVADPKAPAVYALTPNTGRVHHIDIDRLAVHRSAAFGAGAMSMRLCDAARRLYVLYRNPRALIAIDIDDLREAWRIALPLDPADFDIDPEGNAVVSFGEAGKLGYVDHEKRRLTLIAAGQPLGCTRFRPDGRAILTAAPRDRALVIHDVATRRLVVRLPLALEPRHFCFSADLGQLFITGPGMDAVVIVYPYQTEVAQTVLAGHAPGAMAASATDPPYLFVANPGSGEVTILNIINSRVIAVASVGAEPGCIAITPDNQYALVLNRKSGDVAVLLIRDNLANRHKYAGLFTMIPVGSKPVSAAIRAVTG